MQNHLLIKLIKDFKNQEMSVFPLIYDHFKRLIYFYSGKLFEDDATQELTVFLIELLYDINLLSFKPDKSDSLSRYIAVCLRNKYISLSKQQAKELKLSSRLFDSPLPSTNHFSNIEISEALENLSEKQKLIIVYKYIYNYSDFEIASILNISRQAVNRLKNRGILALKEFYSK